MEEEVEDPILAKLNGKKPVATTETVVTTEEADPILEKLNASLKKKDEAPKTLELSSQDSEKLAKAHTELLSKSSRGEPKKVDPKEYADKFNEVIAAGKAYKEAFKDGPAADLPTNKRLAQDKAKKKLNDAVKNLNNPELTQEQRTNDARALVEGKESSLSESTNNLFAGINEAVLKVPSQILKTTAEISGHAGAKAESLVTGEDVAYQTDKDVVYKVADKYDNMIDWLTPHDKNAFTSQIGSGLGQGLSMLFGGEVGAGAKALNITSKGVMKEVAKKVISKPTGIAFSNVFNSEYEGMKARGESDDVAFSQALTNSVASAPLENIPIANLASRFRRSLGAPVAKRLINMVTQTGEEAGQEGVQQALSNFTNNQLVEIESNIKDWNDDLGQSAEVGGGVGFIMSTISSILGGKVRRGKPVNEFTKEATDNISSGEIINNTVSDQVDQVNKAKTPLAEPVAKPPSTPPVPPSPASTSEAVKPPTVAEKVIQDVAPAPNRVRTKEETEKAQGYIQSKIDKLQKALDLTGEDNTGKAYDALLKKSIDLGDVRKDTKLKEQFDEIQSIMEFIGAGDLESSIKDYISTLKDEFKSVATKKIRSKSPLNEFVTPEVSDQEPQEQVAPRTIKVLTEEGGRSLPRIKRRLEEGQITPEEANAQVDELVKNGDVEFIESQPREGTAAAEPTTQGDGKETNQTEGKQEGLLTSEGSTGNVKVLSSPGDSSIIGNNETGETKKSAVANRVVGNELNAKINKNVSERDEYAVRSVKMSDDEAKRLIEEYNDDSHVEALIKDETKKFQPGIRATIAANLYDKYRNAAEEAKGKEKIDLQNRAADLAVWSSQALTRAGQETAIAGKIWKSVLQDEDLAFMALDKQNKQVAKDIIAPIQEGITQSKEQFDAQIQALVEAKVAEQVEDRVKRAKLISEGRRKSISDAFDALKVKDVSGTANDIVRVVGAAAWNSSVEVMKRAVLTGADIANAVQAGVNEIKRLYQGTDFNEEEFRAMVTPVVEGMALKEIKPKIKSSEINEDKIKVPGLKGKKKKDFINQAVDLYNDGKLTDEAFAELVAEKFGYRPYSSEEREQIKSISKVISEAEKFKNTAEEEWAPLTEELKKAQESGDKKKIREVRDKFDTIISKNDAMFKKAQQANKEMQKFARTPSSLSDTLITIIQGNLLTPISLVTNIYSNVLLQGLRFSSSAIGTGLDIATSEISKLAKFGESYKNRSMDLISLQKGYFSGGWNGLMEGVWQLQKGSLPEENNLREIRGSFSPSRAIERWSDGDRQMSQKVNDYVEGTLGIPAEIMFRLLNLGDKPFKRAAELARATELGTLKGLEGTDLLKFITFPDAETQLEIESAGKEATFQQDTELSKAIQAGITKVLDMLSSIPVVGGAAKVILKSQIPYVKTPLNIVIETLDYAIPPLSFSKAVYNYSKGNRRQANILMGKALVGGMIIAAARAMFRMGLMEPEDDYKDRYGKKKEARNLRMETVPPNSINISALQRGMMGGSFEREDDDVQISFKKMGTIGIIFDIHSKELYKNLLEGEPDDNSLLVDMIGSIPNVASASLDQSFLAGTNSLLTAIQDGGGYETEQWIINTTQAISSIALPNTVATTSKANDEYVRDVYDKDFGTRLKNTYLTKVFQGDLVPPKVNIWGEKITGVEDGKSKYFDYLFDVTKFKSVDTDDFKFKLYKMWKNDDYNSDWLPSMPQRTLSVSGVKVNLSGQDYKMLCEMVGKARKDATSLYIRNYGDLDFEKNPKMMETVKEQLKEKYSKAGTQARKYFIMKKGWNVLTKEKLEKIYD